MFTWTPSSTNAEQNARDILSAAMWLHTTFKDEVWLWRGQARNAFGIEPGMHTRVLDSGKEFPHTEATVEQATKHLLATARAIGLDRQGETVLPDLAMLAHLQHYGAGTPLLDVSTDPLIALWMVAFASADAPDALDGESGVIYGIRRPPRERWISPLDARMYSNGDGPSVSSSLANAVWWYQAPDVSERLRIQRGSFLLGPLTNSKERHDSTIPLALGDLRKANWLKARLEKRGKPANTKRSKSDVFGIVVRGSTKKFLRKLLQDRSGLSVETVYPTPWHRPFIGQFAATYGRRRPLAFDLKPVLSHLTKATRKRRR